MLPEDLIVGSLAPNGSMDFHRVAGPEFVDTIGQENWAEFWKPYHSFPDEIPIPDDKIPVANVLRTKEQETAKIWCNHYLYEIQAEPVFGPSEEFWGVTFLARVVGGPRSLSEEKANG